jgi:hypothetical protein
MSVLELYLSFCASHLLVSACNVVPRRPLMRPLCLETFFSYFFFVGRKRGLNQWGLLDSLVWFETQETGRALAFGFATCLTLFVLVLVASALCRREGGQGIDSSLIVMEDKFVDNQLWDGIHEYIL